MTQVDAVIGMQRGDEGKGRFVDLMAATGEYHIVARGNGGANAGHTVAVEGMEPLKLHQVPSGITNPDIMNVIGNGVFLDTVRIASEFADIEARDLPLTPGNLAISDTAHLVLPHHVVLDEEREGGSNGQGSTKRGIAYVSADKFLREGVRVEDTLDLSESELRNLALHGLKQSVKGLQYHKDMPQVFEQRERYQEMAAVWAAATIAIRPFVTDTVGLVNDALRDGKRILAEGAQAHWLDINHGMYPFVTSSSITTNGLLDGLGISAHHLGKVTGVAKLTKSHVGGGPFVTEIHDEEQVARLRGNAEDIDGEYGASTGRARRVGNFDLVELVNAVEINGVTQLALSKVDCASRYGGSMAVAMAYKVGEIEVFRAPSSARALERAEPIYTDVTTWGSDVSNLREYDDLPDETKAFIGMVEHRLNVPVRYVGVGPERDQVIIR